MAVLDAHGAPLGVGAAGDVLDFVERVLDVGLEIGAGIHVLLGHGIAGIDGEHGLHLQVFAPLEELQQAHAVRRVIAPGAGMRGPVDQGADGLLPVEALGDAIVGAVVATGAIVGAVVAAGAIVGAAVGVAAEPQALSNMPSATTTVMAR